MPRGEKGCLAGAVNQAADLWTKCTGSLREQVSDSTWQLWLSGIEPVEYADGVFVLEVPNGLIRERVESRYLPMIEDTLANEVGSPVRGRLQVQQSAPVTATGPGTVAILEPGLDEVFGLPADSRPAPAEAGAPAASASTRSGRDGAAVQLDPKFTFESFVAASSNRLAHAAAQAVAETPGRSYNPLFIYGESGLGKTHLLHAIGNYVTENYSRRKVLYLTTETFMNDFVDSLRTSTTITFKRRYRDCDVLLIDDVQFMERKEGLQEEFFHTYNDLKGASKQIVLTSDRPPKSIETLEDRLRSRFLSGLITEIDPPDLETRLAILRSKCLSMQQDVPDDVLGFIASHVKDNIRELEGALIRICAFAKLNKEPISLAQAEQVLSDLVTAGEPRRISPQFILETTAASYGFSIDAICGPSRTRPLVTARQVAMYLTRELTDYSYPAIGRVFGKRDHTTVIHAVDKIAGQMQERRQIYEQVTELIQKIRAGSA
jgi:chromosomal replication initiator protein